MQRECLFRYIREWPDPEVVPYPDPYPDKSFDLVISINTLHNLYNYDLFSALQEIERVGRGAKYLCVEGYRNEREKMNLMYWQLTCRIFHTPAEWEFDFAQAGYKGDYEFIYFE